MHKEVFMQRALALAREQNPAPNPRVGAVIVKNGEVISEAAHRCPGEAHAEAEALRLAGEHAKGADLYVTLEPCCHSGRDKRTPPCVGRIISAGVKRVYVASVDPNPLVSGRGIAELRAAGIYIETGLLDVAEQYMNRDYRKYQQTGLPWVHLKQAVSLDGFISEGHKERTILSGQEALNYVHGLRASHQAVMVCGGTVIADDPALTMRQAAFAGSSPVRLIAEGMRRLPEDANIFNTEHAETILYTSDNKPERLSVLRQKGVQVVNITSSNEQEAEILPLESILKDAGSRGIISILAEAGGRFASSLLEADLADELSLLYAPVLFGRGISMAAGYKGGFNEAGWKTLPPRMLGRDILVNRCKNREAA